MITPELENQVKSARTQNRQETIAIASTFTAEPIEEFLNFWLEELKLSARVEFAPYNQVFQQLLDPNSKLAANQNGINVILVNFEDWLKYDRNPQESLHSKIERNVRDLINALQAATQSSSTPYLVCLCPASPEFLSVKSQAELVAKMEILLSEELASSNGIYLVTSQEINTTYPVADYFDPQSNELGHIPYTPAYFSALATTIARKLFVLKSAPYKVIAVDCDQTLWKGVCGEVGVAGIEIDPARAKLQQLLLKQQEAGILLCLCSKNVEEDAIAVFEQRSDLPLTLDRLVSWRINWQAKSANLKSLAQELNLGLDSFIFIDDNPVECAEVRANCPQVLTLQMPQEPEAIDKFLAHTWAFDRLKVTAEDQKRTQLYQQNVQRERLRENTLTFQDFLAQLQLEITIDPPQPEQLARVAQLTQRTNQFNATTIRRSETEIEQINHSQTIEIRAITVKDRFGDYGLVGAMLFQAEPEAIAVDTFLLSCRVLGRGVEYQMLTELGKIARDKGLEWVKVSYIPTPKNQPILDFLNNVGAKFQQQSANGLLFQFPASFLIELNYNPQQAIATNKQDNKERSANNVLQPAQSNSFIFERIAQELSAMEQIVQLVNAQQYREITVEERNFVAPRTKTEEQLAQIWSEVLKIKPIGIDDNFFDLGGNSLLAVQLFAKIEQIFQQRLPLTTLLQDSTIEQLARNLDQDKSATHWSPIVPLQPKGSKLPLFLLHARGASVLVYRQLANFLGMEQPVYGIQPQGLNGKATILTKVEELAAYYIQEIQKIQPTGPYLLGGYSFGGQLAFEMARQLQQQGETIDQLILLDCRGPNSYNRLSFSQRILIHFNNLLEKKHEYIIEKVLDWKRWLQDDLQYNLQKLSIKVFQKLNLSLPLKLQNTLIEDRNQQAEKNYQPQFYPGKVTLLRAEEWLGGVGCEIDEYLGWKELVGQDIDIYPIPGDHFSMFEEPYVEKLGETLKSCLNA